METIPEYTLPLDADLARNLTSKVSYDTAYAEFNTFQSPIFGKRQINDSIFSVIYLVPGDEIYPVLTTYNAQGKQIDSETLLHLPGGSDGYAANGLSFLHMDNNLFITITDSINTFTRDSADNIIDSLTVRSVEIQKFHVQPDGTITEK